MIQSRYLILCACLALVTQVPTLLAAGSGQPDASAAPAAAVPPAIPFDLQGFIDERLAAGEKTIVIPPGRHLVKSRNREHLRLSGLRDIVIDATGAELVCSETTRAITINECVNLTLRGLVIDYDPLPFTQARITAISPDSGRLEVETLAGYPELKPSNSKIEIFDPATKELRGRITFYNTAVEVKKTGHASLVLPDGRSASASGQIGDIVVIDKHDAPGGFMPHAIMVSSCEGLVLENITLYSGVTFGFFENQSKGSAYINCHVDRRPGHLDYAKRGFPRVRSVNADAFHSKNARSGPRYERCVARFNGDDSFAINGDFHLISRGDANTLRVLAKHSMNMRVGDMVQIFTKDGHRLENRKITAIAPDGVSTPEEKLFISRQRMDANLRKNGMKNAYLVTLDRPVGETPRGSLIGSADAIGDGFAIRDCTLGHNRSRGILVKAGRGEITGNTIEGTVMPAILISPEYWWLEAGFADNLLIANNTLRNIRGPGIIITAGGGEGSIADAGAFRDITVRDNTISGGPAPGLLISSVAGLVSKDNTVSIDSSKSLNSWELSFLQAYDVQAEMSINNK